MYVVERLEKSSLAVMWVRSGRGIVPERDTPTESRTRGSRWSSSPAPAGRTSTSISEGERNVCMW